MTPPNRPPRSGEEHRRHDATHLFRRGLRQFLGRRVGYAGPPR